MSDPSQLSKPETAQTYIYRWDRQGRKGHRCKVTARGKMNSCLVVFDGDKPKRFEESNMKHENEQPAPKEIPGKLEWYEGKLRAGGRRPQVRLMALPLTL
jgi:hypothetical protein